MKKNVFFSLLAVLCVVAITSVAYSEWETMNITRNYTTLASVEGVIKEEYIQDSPVYPGGNVKKVSQIINTGTVPAVVRVNIEKGWDDFFLDTDKVEIQFKNCTKVAVWENGEQVVYSAPDGKLVLNQVAGDGYFVVPLA